MLGLRFCARAFSSCGKWGPLFIAVRGPLTIAALSLSRPLLLRSTGSRRAGSVVVAHGLSHSAACGSSQTRARTRVPCIGRQILNHCATREAPALGLCCCAWGFSSCGEREPTLRFGAQTLGGGYSASRCSGFSCCRTRALGVRASVVAARRLSSCGLRALERRLSICGSRA